MNVVRPILRSPRLTGCGLAAVAWLAACAAGPAEPIGKQSEPVAGPSYKPVGSAGCAASNCHGRPDAPSLTGDPPPDCWRSSATHWRAVDPHTNAYALLERLLAKEMIAKLRKGDASYKEATEEARCLACHTNPALAVPGAFGFGPDVTARLRSEGVGCEGCHGNAAGWQFAHTGWRLPGKRPDPSARYGMVPLDDLGVRALACAGCHVGAPADPSRGYPVRDMNHDMIAAGHPRLNFDFRTYARRIRPHWYEPPRPAGAEGQLWLIGRVAQAEALARLHDARGAGVELSEFNCFGCHHDLTPADWRGKAPKYYAGRRPGELAWQLPWPLGKPGVLREPERTAVDEFVKKAVSATAGPAAAQLAAARMRLTSELTQGKPIPPATFLGMVRVEADDLRKLDWDQACGLYYALRAGEADLVTAGRRPDVSDLFATLAERLALPRQNGKRTDSPISYSPERVREPFQQLQDRLRAAAK